MKRSFLSATLLMFILSTAFISAQENQQDMMKAWQEYMTPGAMHKILEKSVGEWHTDVSSWMDPSQPPAKMEGTSVCEAILGGRYFQSKYTATFMNMPFSGVEISGYDNAKKTFFSTWIDNFGTGILVQEGKYDEATNTITYTGTSTDPMGNEVKMRQTVKFIDDNTLYSEMFMTQGGKEFKSMEMKMTRKR